MDTGDKKTGSATKLPAVAGATGRAGSLHAGDRLPVGLARSMKSAGMVIQLAKNATMPLSASHGEACLAGAMGFLCDLVSAALILARTGRRSENPEEQVAAERIEEHLKRLCFSLMGGWFFDWMNGLSVFLVNYRELLAKHEGEFVLIAATPGGEEWEILGVSPEPAELVARAQEAGLSTEQYFVREIIAGADQIPVLDFARPESTWEEGESEEAMGSSAGRECDAPDHT